MASRASVVFWIACVALGCASDPTTVLAPVRPKLPDASSTIVESFRPEELEVDGGAATLTFTGNLSGARILWSATGRTTQLSTSEDGGAELLATVPPDLLRVPVLAWVSVWGPGSMEIWTTHLPVRAPPPVGTTPFRAGPDLNFARSWHCAVALADGRVLIVGGPQRIAEVFDPPTGRFELTGALHTVRWLPSATQLPDGKVLVAGGWGPDSATAGNPLLASAEIWDPATGVFTVTGSMNVARAEHTATLLNDGTVLLTGGNDFPAVDSAEIYDPATGGFTRVGSMTSARTEHTATLLPSGQVLIAGGWNGHLPDSLDDPPWDPLQTELFDPVRRTFSSSAIMSATRFGHQAVRLADGQVLLLGGIPPIQNLHEGQTLRPEYAEVFEPATIQLSAGPEAIGTVQSDYTATLLRDGGILLAGGDEGFVSVASAAVLDLDAGQILPIAGMGVPRQRHTATALVDGRVLITGGFDAQGSMLSSTELYQ